MFSHTLLVNASSFGIPQLLPHKIVGYCWQTVSVKPLPLHGMTPLFQEISINGSAYERGEPFYAYQE